MATAPENLELPLFHLPRHRTRGDLLAELIAFDGFGKSTRTLQIAVTDPRGNLKQVPACVNEFWTAKQRQANSLHEVSYRACFKPQLPRFFIQRLTTAGEAVYDPFMGRGTTPLEAALLGRVPCGNDANPLSIVMTRPRLNPPFLTEVAKRLGEIDFRQAIETPQELLAFYHPQTLQAICSLRGYLHQRRQTGRMDSVDEWISLVALNRLTGHSSGFFSVYTLPPNQAVSVRSQLKINQKRAQIPPQRDIAAVILKKSKQLLGDIGGEARTVLAQVAPRAMLLTAPASQTPAIASGSVSLVVTSPPFLNVVQYATDNWLRCWFLGLDPKAVRLTTPTKLDAWEAEMAKVFRELCRVLRPGGHIAFEVGEVHSGKTRLEETVLPCGMKAGLEPLLVLINDQKFTKTANCWGIDNMSKGTNTNRIVLFRKP
ncbi:MAG TPA: DNA methyltransferase [Verrucomicrobiae bacterium]